MKIAVACSLQGPPEEPIAHRVGRFLAESLARDYPSGQVELYERADYPGRGDAYTAVANDINRWRADVAIHIHADASWSREAYGFSVLYCRGDSLSLADYVLAGLAHELLPRGFSRSRGLSQRCDVAVLRRAVMPAALVEVGFYTSPKELSLLQQEWYCAIVAHAIRIGMNKWIERKLGVFIEPAKTDRKGGDEKVVDFVRLMAREKGQGPFAGKEVDVWKAFGCGSDYIHLSVTCARPGEIIMLFADSPYSQRGLGSKMVQAQFFGNQPVRLCDLVPMRPSDYVWVTVHMLPGTSERFRGFLRP